MNTKNVSRNTKKTLATTMKKQEKSIDFQMLSASAIPKKLNC